MSSCEKYMEMASEYLDGELSPDERAELLTHLEKCSECRAFYEAIRGISENMDITEAPEGFAKGVMDALGERPSGKGRCKKRKIFARVTALAACLALVVAAGIKLTLPERDNNSATGEPALFGVTGVENDVEERDIEGTTPEAYVNPADASYYDDVEAVTIEHGGATTHFADPDSIAALIDLLANVADTTSTPDAEPDCVVTFELADGDYLVKIWDDDGKLICASEDGMWIAVGTLEELHDLLV